MSTIDSINRRRERIRELEAEAERIASELHFERCFLQDAEAFQAKLDAEAYERHKKRLEEKGER
jgi:hypothetical protein